jgi:hypothetical protein
MATHRADGFEVRLTRRPDRLRGPAPRYWRHGRGLDIKAGAAKLKAERVARLEAELVIDRWNRRLATGRDMLWSPPGCSPGTHFAKMFVSVILPGVRARCGRKGNSHWAAE